MKFRFSGIEEKIENNEVQNKKNFDDLENSLNTLPKKITDAITLNFKIEGAQVGRADFIEFQNNMDSTIRTYFNNLEQFLM